MAQTLRHVTRRWAKPSRRWDEPKPWAPGEFLAVIAVNLRAVGALTVALDATAEPATARPRCLPDAGLCERVGGSVDEVLRYSDAHSRVARAREEVGWSWRRNDQETVYTAGWPRGSS